MARFLKIVGMVVGVLLLVVIMAGSFARPKVRSVVTPSGRTYDLLTDVVTSDHRYFIKYLAHSTDLETLEEGAYDLMQLVTSNPRAKELRTLSIEADVGSGIGLFTVYRGYGYIFENRGGKWERSDAKGIHDSIVGSGMKEIGSSRNR
jgi:anionic cell wall polymer biosynthesis LytR-Cps2A-Psr (LCP) family protein